MLKNQSVFVMLFLLFSCGSVERGEKEAMASSEVHFEYIDSVIVESLAELYLADKDEKTGRLLFNDWNLTELLLSDVKGQIISRVELAGEGPNQVMQPVEVAFYEKGIVVKEMTQEGRLNFYNGSFEKTGKSPTLSKGLNFLTIPNSFRTFSVMENDGEILILGQDPNTVDAELISRQGQNGSFYSKAKLGYIYVPDSEEFARLNIYPETWKPKSENKWAGIATPFVQASKMNQIVAVLPQFGNQLFYYTLKGSKLYPLEDITLNHTDRNEDVSFDVQKDDWILYPYFSALISGGEYFLVEFHTEFPRDRFEWFRAQNERFHMEPEFHKALEKHRLTKYILTDTHGSQGEIIELPISGKVHFMDIDDVIYIKPTSDIERDYNVFYRYRVSLIVK